MRKSAEQNLLEGFQASRAGEPAWLAGRRKEAADVFRASGLPGRRTEAWRYTDLRRAVGVSSWPPLQGTGPVLALSRESPFAGLEAVELLFVNGEMKTDLSSLNLPPGLSVMPLSEDRHEVRSMLDKEPDAVEPVITLNTAMMRNGVVIRVSAGTVVPGPLLLRFITQGTGAAHLRCLLVLEEGASMTLLESHEGGGQGSTLNTIVTHQRLDTAARLVHVKLQHESRDTLHLASGLVSLERSARLDSLLFSSGARLSRNQVHVSLDGKKAAANIHAVHMLYGAQHGDTSVVTHHTAPDCESGSHVKSVLADQASGVFQGKLIVGRGAQGTQGHQLSNALLLSLGASMNAKPELEIFSDDVQCTHGSTIGELDIDALFYLRSRGIRENGARALLIAAFLDEVLEKNPFEPARDILRERINAWFEKTGIGKGEAA